MRVSTTLLLAAVAAASHAGSILGIDDSRVYKIDVTTGLATSVGALTGTGTGQANALAYNRATNTAYFQRGNKLWSMNVGTGATASTGITIGNTAGATFHNGAYYYMSSTGSKLYKVSFTGLTASAPVLVKDFTNAWSFGDIAVNSDGKLYGSSGSTLFSFDLNTPPYVVTNISTSSVQTQLGFVGGQLYGVATGNSSGGATGQLFTFNGSSLGSTGIIAKYNGSALAVNDAATISSVPGPAAAAPFLLGALGSLRKRRKKA